MKEGLSFSFRKQRADFVGSALPASPSGTDIVIKGYGEQYRAPQCPGWVLRLHHLQQRRGRAGSGVRQGRPGGHQSHLRHDRHRLTGQSRKDRRSAQIRAGRRFLSARQSQTFSFPLPGEERGVILSSLENKQNRE